LLATLAVLIAIVAGLLLADLLLFARHRDPTFREAAIWSAGWFALSLAVAPVVLLLKDGAAALDYTTVYLIERSLSLDNLFVFLLLFAYFRVPHERRAGLLLWGIALALVLRGAAILGGTALIERFHAVIYVLGATLLLLAWRMLRGVDEQAGAGGAESSLPVRLARRVKSDASPLTLALLSMVFADIAFAVDSIPAAFAVTTDALVIWAANAFALLGMRALFVLVEGLVGRFRYLSQTIAVVLGIVAVKLLIEDLVKIGPLASLGLVAAAFAVGIAASLAQDRRLAADPTGR
jgi:predicted tellurium resistance membrane protein TerC